jgi:hypothetical protein
MENVYQIEMLMSFESFLPLTVSSMIQLFGVPMAKITMIFALSGLAILAVFLIIRFLRKKQQKGGNKKILSEKEEIEKILSICREQLNDSLMQIHLIYTSGIGSFLNEDLITMKVASGIKKQLNKNLKELKKGVFNLASKLESNIHSGHYYVELNDYQNRIASSVNLLFQPLYEHLNNSHKPFVKSQEEELKNLGRDVGIFFNQALTQINNHVKQLSKLDELHNRTIEILGKMEIAQIHRIKSKQVNTRNSILYLNTLAETKNMLNHTLSLVKTYQKLLMD